MELFPPQKEVLSSGILFERQHCVLNMPTGSGKTFLAEFAIEETLKQRQKVIYVTPLRALADQQAARWIDRFAPYTLGVFTGDTTQKNSNKNNYCKSDLLIMTPERLDACLRNWRSHWSWIPEVNLLVVDEFHLLGQARRGPRLEGALTRFIRLNPFVKIMALSATVPNTEELSSWLNGTTYSSQWRQIPPEKRVLRFSSAKDKPTIMLNEAKRCIAEGGQSLIFCNSRSRVQQITSFLNANGINAACHHAGLSREERTETEEQYKRHTIQALVATSTLEMGLNLPARQVIIYDSYSYSDSGFSQLPVWSFIQRAGRAGRPGLDTSGEVILMLPKWEGNAEKYIRGECEPVHSQLTDPRSMNEQILVDVFAGFSRTRTELIDGFLPLTLYKNQHKAATISGTINRLILADMLIESEDELDNRKLKVGLLGRLAVKLMIDPETVKMVQVMHSSYERLYLFDLLLIAALSEDCSPVLRANYEEIDALCDVVATIPSVLMDLSIEKLKKKCPTSPDTLRVLAAIKMAAICHLLTTGKSAEEIADNFDIYAADVRMLQESMIRLLMSISAITSAIDKSNMGEEEGVKERQRTGSTSNLANRLATMLQYEISSDLVNLTQLHGVGGKTARLLAAAGYSDIEVLSKATSAEIFSIKGIGKKSAESITKQARKLVQTGALESYSEEQNDSCVAYRSIKSSIDPYRLRRSLELTIRGHEGSVYYITGGREDHIVRFLDAGYVCDCLDYQKNGGICKHILCVKRSKGDAEITKLIKKIKEDKNHSIREALPTLWYSMTAKERD